MSSTTLPAVDLDLDALDLLGPIVRLQVQVAPLKQGSKPHHWYEPEPITAVPHIRIDSGGVQGIDRDTILNDVHHRDHPLSRYRGENGISIGFTSHYRKMRDHFGDHMVDGIAGENLIIASDLIHEEQSFADGIVVITTSGPIELKQVEVSPPCSEFGKFCLHYPHEASADAAVGSAVKFLHQGTRGFYATWATTSNEVTTPHMSVGDLVYRRRSS